MMTGVELAPGHKQGLLLSNPIMPTAGGFGYGTEYEGLFEARELGAIVTTPTTLRPQRGRPLPRLCETAGGFLLDTGGQNPGIDRVLREHRARWARSSVPIILNIAGVSAEEFAAVSVRASDVVGIRGLELTLPPDADGPAAHGIVLAVREQTMLPVWAKLPLCGAEELAGPCLDGGANALTVGQQPLGLVLDAPTKHRLRGLLYGTMVRPLALRAVDAVRRRVDAPIIASGGIYTVEDALAFLEVGASALQVGSATWVEPQTMTRLVTGIAGHRMRGVDETEGR